MRRSVRGALREWFERSKFHLFFRSKKDIQKTADPLHHNHVPLPRYVFCSLFPLVHCSSSRIIVSSVQLSHLGRYCLMKVASPQTRRLPKFFFFCIQSNPIHIPHQHNVTAYKGTWTATVVAVDEPASFVHEDCSVIAPLSKLNVSKFISPQFGFKPGMTE